MRVSDQGYILSPILATTRPGDALPERERECDIIQAFFYGAAMWNAHRIHYELAYAREAEGYPGLVVPGPLMGDWLCQCVEDWLGDAGQLLKFTYSNRIVAIVGQTLTVGGGVSSVERATREVELELWVKNASGEVIMPGTARVRMAQ